MSQVDTILAGHQETSRDHLIPLLQEVQEKEGYLSREAIIKISEKLKVSPSKVFGVATFYNQFRFQPLGKYHIQLCRGTACHVKGSAKLLETVTRYLKIAPGQTARDGVFSLEVVACMGACGLAPVINVNGEFFAEMTPGKANELLESYRQKEMKNEGQVKAEK